MEQHICKNCGTQFEVNFCNVCGQKPAHRLDVKHLFHEVLHVFTHADKGIFSFIQQVLTRPGSMALEYVEGKRKKYFNPVQYLVLVVGLITFMMAKSNLMEETLATMNSTLGNKNLPPKIALAQRDIMQFIQRYFNIVMLILIPVYSLFSWLLFKKSGYNYAENVVVQIFLQAQVNTISAVTFYPLIFLFKSQLSQLIVIIPLMILALGFIVTFAQFFKVSWWQAFWKGVLIYLLTNICQAIISMIIIIFYVLIKK